MNMLRRRLYTPVFHIDTNMINARCKLASMNQLEIWAKDDLILINMSNSSFSEAIKGGNLTRTKKALSQIITLTDENIDVSNEIYRKVNSALFPEGAKDDNQRNDVKIVCEAIKYNALLITNDGGSKRQPGGILGNAHKIAHLLTIRTGDQAVEYINNKIIERDMFNRKVSDATGEKLPYWTGKDYIKM